MGFPLFQKRTKSQDLSKIIDANIKSSERGGFAKVLNQFLFKLKYEHRFGKNVDMPSRNHVLLMWSNTSTSKSTGIFSEHSFPQNSWANRQNWYREKGGALKPQQCFIKPFSRFKKKCIIMHLHVL